MSDRDLTKEKCELCGGPLDESCWINRSADEYSGYCTKCIHPEGTVFEVLNYFEFAVQEEPLMCYNDDGTTTIIPWPHPKCPALWHKKACRLFPLWKEIVNEFKSLRKIKYFDTNALREFVNWLISAVPERSAEQALIIRRDKILEMLREETRGREAKSRAGVAFVNQLMSGLEPAEKEHVVERVVEQRKS